jgi:hypothetical protein
MVDLKSDTYIFYKKVGGIYSKALKQKIAFNRYGWIHLSFTSNGHRRSAKDRRLRFHLFYNAPEVVRKAGFLIKETQGNVRSKRGVIRKVTYYEIADSCDHNRKHLTVVIRKIESGNAHFYSLRRTSHKIKKALKK